MALLAAPQLSSSLDTRQVERRGAAASALHLEPCSLAGSKVFRVLKMSVSMIGRRVPVLCHRFLRAYRSSSSDLQQVG